MNPQITYTRPNDHAERTMPVPSAGWHIAHDGDYEEATGLRTDYTVCTCVNGRHHASWHRTHPRPGRPNRAEVERVYPGGHVVEREIAWTGWVTA